MIAGGDKIIGPRSSRRYVDNDPSLLFDFFRRTDKQTRKDNQGTPVINVEGVDEYLHTREGHGWRAYSRQFKMENGQYRTVQALRIQKRTCLVSYFIKIFDEKGMKILERELLTHEGKCGSF